MNILIIGGDVLRCNELERLYPFEDKFEVQTEIVSRNSWYILYNDLKTIAGP